MKEVIRITLAAVLIIVAGSVRISAQRTALFEIYGTDSTNIVMLGNSLTAGVDWNELLKNPDVVNRGIIGDDSPAMLNRINCITAGKPRKIFLMAGVNDISHDITADSVARAVAELVDTIMMQTPESKLYIQSLLPANDSFGRYKTMVGKKQTIRDVNVLLKEMAEQRGLTFVDIHEAFCDEEGNLKAEWTPDGLHLLAPAYVCWRDLLLPYINE